MLQYNKHDSTIINQNLEKVSQWLDTNRLVLNTKKTKFILFHNSRKNIHSFIPNIMVNNQNIDNVQEFNFLGLTFDQHLNWTNHTKKISLKIARYIGLLSKIKHYVPFEILKTLYNSLIMPQLLYGILAWGKNITHVTKLQKKSIRVITCSRYNEHTEPLFKTLKLLKIEDLFILSALKFYYKHCHRLLPYYLQSFELTTRLELCPYNIRTKHCLHTTKIKRKAAENSI